MIYRYGQKAVSFLLSYRLSCLFLLDRHWRVDDWMLDLSNLLGLLGLFPFPKALGYWEDASCCLGFDSDALRLLSGQ